METALTERKQNNGMVEIASSRQAQEVQAAMVIAQRFPRDVNKAFTRVMEDCKRRSLAEKAVYSYPRGGLTVTGPSIRLAETIAKAYGNLDFGVIELEKKANMGGVAGESTMMAYCWDLETNTRSTKIFTVAHKRDTKQGSKLLTDERDIYEIAANNGARRLRACILSVIPTDIVEAGLAACKKTMLGGDGPLIDRVRSMIIAFKEVGVTQDMIEKNLGHKFDAITEEELVNLRTIYTSLKDGVANREDFFELNPESEKDVTPAKAETEVKTFAKPKNFAPQTAEEANTQEAARLDAEAASKPASATDERQVAVKELLDLQKKLEMTNEAFTSDIKNLMKKRTAELSTKEIQELILIYKARVVQKEQG